VGLQRQSVRWIAAVLTSAFAWPCQAAETHGTIPDFTGIWGRNTFDFEAVPSAPPPIGNLYRLPSGSSDPARPVGDYNNPILKPAASAIIRQRSERALQGKTFPDPSTRCAPYPPPFVAAMQLALQMLQTKDGITILYNQDDQVRHVRLNGKHPDHVTPSWKGDSIGHYEGDTLVVDTVGIKTDALAVVDRYGTPLGEGAHIVERYRLIDAADAKRAQELHEKEAGHLGGPPPDDKYPKGLDLQITIENPAYFTKPLPVRVTYRRSTAEWLEQVCAENPDNGYAKAESPPIPKAEKPDF